MTKLIIAGAAVKTDVDGRYSLNDLHKAAGGERKHGPSLWMANQQTKDLIAILETTGNPVVKTEGRNGGTFVVKQLVYAYAMWVKPEFHLAVINSYDDLVNGQLSEARRAADRETARLEFKPMAEALVLSRQALGKETKPHHHINEANLLNRIAIGMTSAQFKAEHGLSPNAALRDFLTELQEKCIVHLQRANTTMLEIGYTYEQRKTELKKLYDSRHAAGLLAEVKRLES